jgi:hypothetical protein
MSVKVEEAEVDIGQADKNEKAATTEYPQPNPQDDVLILQ